MGNDEDDDRKIGIRRQKWKAGNQEKCLNYAKG